MLKITKEGIVINLKISPNSSNNSIIKEETGVKIKLTAQPIEGKANKALVEFLSKQLKVPKTSIQVIKGETSKDKTILIKTFDDSKINLIKEILD